MERQAWDERYAGPELIWGAGPNRFVVEQLAGLSPGRAIDLATGEGRNAIWLASQGWKVTAVDFSAVGVARAADLAAQRGVSVDWVTADLREYQPEPSGFDLVLIAYLQLPIADLTPILARAAAALAPGGTLLLVGHDRENLEHGTGGPQDPVRLHTPQEIVSALPGLRIDVAERRKRPVTTPDGDKDAIDTLVRAVRPGAGSEHE
ncbi:MAG TPA: class I SAM-dependent methyltransferase [Streptosporangiaceae bacterium]